MFVSSNIFPHIKYFPNIKNVFSQLLNIVSCHQSKASLSHVAYKLNEKFILCKCLNLKVTLYIKTKLNQFKIYNNNDI